MMKADWSLGRWWRCQHCGRRVGPVYDPATGDDLGFGHDGVGDGIVNHSPMPLEMTEMGPPW